LNFTNNAGKPLNFVVELHCQTLELHCQNFTIELSNFIIELCHSLPSNMSSPLSTVHVPSPDKIDSYENVKTETSKVQNLEYTIYG
jgi:hypothetical protein